MAPPLWSKQGCWTCRLRKKKCDEGHPQCSTCESLSITCHGYGSKPDWMDGGDGERAVANGIKEVVKHTSRRKTAQSVKHRDPAKIAPKSTTVSESSSSPVPSLDKPDAAFSVDETTLLMHFLDNLFTNYGNAWHSHLRAAINMYLRSNKYGSAPTDLTGESRAVLNKELPLLEYEALVSNDTAHSRFMSGTLIWLDIVSCITAATTPHLLEFHSTVMAPDSQTQLEDIMGCKNWVMLQIGRIAALHANKLQALRQGHFNCEEFKQTIIDIDIEIQSGLEAYGPDYVALCNPTTLITPLFAIMASVYLHLITHGFQELGILDVFIARAMIILQTEVPTHVLPALVAPLYVIGSVARQGDEQFFRDAFSSPPLLDTSLKQRTRILPILEEVWDKRRAESSFLWEDSLELIPDILLI
ncbi:hypothetical protein VE03_05488 [Pseudogymnoascus sp. 23342-1-I1]|nr:hypothetical protein VE03_05488 [Pseudogymnoascus sp. 23342-1-I1]